MSIGNWKKRENEAGFPYYICGNSNAKQWDHPAYSEVMIKVSLAADVRYAVYRMAYKLLYLQEQLKVPDISLISGVFAHHCLSISENTFVLEPCEIEAILTDVYFAAGKKGCFDGNVDLATELTLNFLLNVYDRERTSSVSVQSAKTGLALLCNSSIRDVWSFLFSTISDHNGCIRPRRLSSLLNQVAAVSEYLGEGTTYGKHTVQAEVDKCFAKTPGMLGLSELGMMQWLETGPTLLSWTHVRERLRLLRLPQNSSLLTPWKCSLCSTKNPPGLKFKCIRCWGMMVCEKCYLYNETKPGLSNLIHRHNKSHIVKEIIDSQAMPSKCMVGLIRSMKKVLSCPSNCRRNNPATNVHFPLQANGNNDADREPNIQDTERVASFEAERKMESDKASKENNPRVYTSTIGKALGKRVTDPRTILQDIISQLEAQNKALKNLSCILNESQQNGNVDKRLQYQVDNHWGQISIQINRLKMLKENLIPSITTDNSVHLNPHHCDGNMKMEAFEMFSPIPVMPKECYNESAVLEHKNIVSGSEEDQQGATSCNMKSSDLIKASRTDGIVPRTIQYCDDSISRVSMADISMWFSNETNVNKDNPVSPDVMREIENNRLKIQPGGPSLEDKFNADLDCVASSNNKMKELNADLDSVLDRLQSILANNFTLDDTSFDNIQLKETANEMEGLLGTLIRGVEQRSHTVRGCNKL